jgi:hypothetical protein
MIRREQIESILKQLGYSLAHDGTMGWTYDYRMIPTFENIKGKKRSNYSLWVKDDWLGCYSTSQWLPKFDSIIKHNVDEYKFCAWTEDNLWYLLHSDEFKNYLKKVSKLGR